MSEDGCREQADLHAGSYHRTSVSETHTWRRRLFCDILGWHYKVKPIYWLGINLHGTCKLCGKDCIQDSQGNWF